MRLYEEFIKFSGCAKQYTQYQLTCDCNNKYHYVMRIILNDDIKVLQSNISLTIESSRYAFSFLVEIPFNSIIKDYDNTKIIDKWEKQIV